MEGCDTPNHQRAQAPCHVVSISRLLEGAQKMLTEPLIACLTQHPAAPPTQNTPWTHYMHACRFTLPPIRFNHKECNQHFEVVCNIDGHRHATFVSQCMQTCACCGIPEETPNRSSTRDLQCFEEAQHWGHRGSGSQHTLWSGLPGCVDST
jgi:hypothetical protein